MSTPTTATATLPHYHPHHYPQSYTHSHSHHQTYQPSPSANFRSAASNQNILPPPVSSAVSPSHSAILPPPYQLSPLAYSSSASNGAALTHSSNSRTAQQAQEPSPRNDAAYSVSSMPESASTSNAEQSSRKRRRSREPDWTTFYKNGLPKEIIVIDDTPEPEANTSRKITNGTAPAPSDNTTRQVAKKRRREDESGTVQASGYHIKYLESQKNTPLQMSTPAGSSNSSSDRTNSALNTTAPTSLSSNGQYEEAQAPLKRKRTRQQVANEAKRRDVDGLGDFFTYKPPPYPPKKAGEVNVQVIHDRHYNKSVKVDDDDGHYIVVPDAELTEKYQIVRLLGQGTFGKVVEARDRKRNKAVAVKIIRSVQKYRDASRIELRVLETLKRNDEENRNRCIHLRDCFDYRGHICIVMDLLDQSVFDFLKGNGFVPFPNSQIQSFARQLFTSVAFLHDLNLIHTDLKPENILLCDHSYQTFTYNRKIPSSSTTINRQATQRRVLLDTEIRLIDFGSATFQDEYHSSVVSTRHYRAPEIILGLGWSFPCDIWSIGCILVEFFTGDALFQTHDNLEHLAMMEAVVGSRIDSHLVQAVNKMSTRSGGNAASKYFKRLRLDYPTQDTTRGSRRFVKAMKHIDQIIPGNNTFLKNFVDLLKRIFVYDPAHRITAKQALQHPWLKEMAQPDDGTEAAKIRQERLRMEQQAQNPRHQYARS
ncbi:CMGC CLK kinase [Fusarium heterosporum]|uniref:dual-specificity kinase n=1 Tax=Fusarium heterosporum TaxID=42747 RepID=A0A8H5SYM3_FUSHE|nr:CMGC CLK kinase [Fusarium heterosporum]